jgi:nucleoside 2-deoxyribosyltransferase
MSPTVYLAGFDVFRSDAVAHGAWLKQRCAARGLQGRYPIDNQLPAGLTPAEAAGHIYRHNVRMLRECSAVLANLTVFRGLEPDSGTVFEVGMAVALGKPVWAYFEPVGDLRALVGSATDGFSVEDFGLPRNLMLACSWAGWSATAEQAIADLGDYLHARSPGGQCFDRPTS